MDFFIAIMLFAVSSSITPGPNNIMMLSSGLSFGVRKSLPLLFGICIGFPVMVISVGLGASALFDRYPILHVIIKVAGTLYLLYFAYQIATANTKIERKAQTKPLTFLNGALFQWVNAKAWVVALGAVATFTSVGESFLSQNLSIALTFLIVSFPCVGVWLVFGSLLTNVLKDERSRKAFNLSMALLLVLSVGPVVFEIFGTMGLT